MKKNTVVCSLTVLLLCGCGTYAGQGAYTGATFGSVLGSAIGGISGGPRGSDIGTIIGMAGGAVIGGAIGDAADKRAHEEMVEHREAVKQRRAEAQRREQADMSGFDDTNSGDDRIYDFDGADYTGTYSAQQPTEVMPVQSAMEMPASSLAYAPHIDIRNARFVDDDQNGVISRGELSKVIFEVVNTGQTPIYDVQPTVVDASMNKHIYISPNMHVESIAPGRGIRYTALVKADNRLRAGYVKICLSVLQGDKAISKVLEFNIPTRK